MPYDADFYSRYASAIGSIAVRTFHDEVVDLYCKHHPGEMRTVDLGCGTCEFADHGFPDDYLGVDLNGDLGCLGSERRVIRGDFLDLPTDVAEFKPTSIVSLFATELFVPEADREDYYAGLFVRYPDVKSMLVAGFYYAGRESEPVIDEQEYLESEPSGATHVVRQTVGPIRPRPEFSEIRVSSEIPYEMFGPGVIEVWKIMIRRP